MESMNFKTQLEKDAENIFFNLSEFAEIKRLEYAGKIKDIPVMTDNDEINTYKGKAEGLNSYSIIISFMLKDFDIVPKSGGRIYINNDFYRIDKVILEKDIYTLYLSELDE